MSQPDNKSTDNSDDQSDPYEVIVVVDDRYVAAEYNTAKVYALPDYIESMEESTEDFIEQLDENNPDEIDHLSAGSFNEFEYIHPDQPALESNDFPLDDVSLVVRDVSIQATASTVVTIPEETTTIEEEEEFRERNFMPENDEISSNLAQLQIEEFLPNINNDVTLDSAQIILSCEDHVQSLYIEPSVFGSHSSNSVPQYMIRSSKGKTYVMPDYTKSLSTPLEDISERPSSSQNENFSINTHTIFNENEFKKLNHILNSDINMFNEPENVYASEVPEKIDIQQSSLFNAAENILASNNIVHNEALPVSSRVISEQQLMNKSEIRDTIMSSIQVECNPCQGDVCEEQAKSYINPYYIEHLPVLKLENPAEPRTIFSEDDNTHIVLVNDTGEFSHQETAYEAVFEDSPVENINIPESNLSHSETPTLTRQLSGENNENNYSNTVLESSLLNGRWEFQANMYEPPNYIGDFHAQNVPILVNSAPSLLIRESTVNDSTLINNLSQLETLLMRQVSSENHENNDSNTVLGHSLFPDDGVYQANMYGPPNYVGNFHPQNAAILVNSAPSQLTRESTVNDSTPINNITTTPNIPASSEDLHLSSTEDNIIPSHQGDSTDQQ